MSKETKPKRKTVAEAMEHIGLKNMHGAKAVDNLLAESPQATPGDVKTVKRLDKSRPKK